MNHNRHIENIEMQKIFVSYVPMWYLKSFLEVKKYASRTIAGSTIYDNTFYTGSYSNSKLLEHFKSIFYSKQCRNNLYFIADNCVYNCAIGPVVLSARKDKTTLQGTISRVCGVTLATIQIQTIETKSQYSLQKYET
ncbi:hypothetical protein [Maribellus luteus]|uniref:hypothetical protein n=1 Tax=Maribellus luteus TaxID=2305463 RepID=UPI0011C4349F|nr:hypothetical protein [Maribellus luteus]